MADSWSWHWGSYSQTSSSKLAAVEPHEPAGGLCAPLGLTYWHSTRNSACAGCTSGTADSS